MTSPDFSQNKETLIKELALLENELKSVGRINPDNKSDWEPVASELNVDKAEVEERAMQITHFEDRSSVEFQLEERFNKTKAALERITNGTYGICSVCGKMIEEARLHANAAAMTCKEHKEL